MNSRFELNRAQRGFDGRHLRGRFLREGRPPIVFFLRHRVLRAKPLGTLQLGGRPLNGRAGAHEFGAQTIDFGLERPRIDLEQRDRLS